MSSKGTPIVQVRIADADQLHIMAVIGRRNAWSKRPPWTFSDFIRVACQEKIAKMRRSRAPRGRKRITATSSDGGKV